MSTLSTCTMTDTIGSTAFEKVALAELDLLSHKHYGMHKLLKNKSIRRLWEDYFTNKVGSNPEGRGVAQLLLGVCFKGVDPHFTW